MKHAKDLRKVSIGQRLRTHFWTPPGKREIGSNRPISRYLSLILALCMVLSLVPVSAFATGDETTTHVHDADCGYNEDEGDASCAYYVPQEEPQGEEEMEQTPGETPAAQPETSEESPAAQSETPEESPAVESEPAEKPQDEGSQTSMRKAGARNVEVSHSHAICGSATCSDGSNHESVGWTAWDSEDSLPGADATATYYYLDTDVELDEYSYSGWEPTKDVVLCLNGHTISIDSNAMSGAITVNSGVTVTITDCQETCGKITGCTATANGGGVNVNGGTFNLYNGSITGNKATKAGGVYVNGGEFNLYGGSITGNTDNQNGGGGVYVNAGTFTMNGGTISNNTAKQNGGGVYVNAGTFTMNGGTITGNTATSLGGGVYISTGATFNMTNGTISSNKATGGGGVYTTGATFNMSNGTISGNTATYGGGVKLEVQSKFYMSGGSVTKNTADGGNDGNGGGVDVNSSDFHMSGGSITENTAKSRGGGVDVYQDKSTATLYVSGTVNISGNTSTNYPGNGNDVTVGWNQYRAIRIEGKLDPSSKIGVTVQNTGSGYFTGTTYPITSGWKDSGSTDFSVFICNDTGYGIAVNPTSGELYVENTTQHKGTCDDGLHVTTTTWTAWSTKDALPTDKGSYYLTTDVTISSSWTPASGTVLCLNGHTITYSNADAKASVITVAQGRTFTLTDCLGTGKVTGGTGTSNCGGGVYINNGTFKLYGGIITGNSANYYGGGVYVSGSSTTFNMTGGSISGNTTDGKGGGVYTTSSATFTMTGGTISGNKAYSGCGVYQGGDGDKLYLSGTAKITGNTSKGASSANSLGGGVYVSGTAEIKDSAEISGNTAYYGGGVYVNSGTLTMSGGSISNNQADSHGCGVFVVTNATFTMTGGTISGNTARYVSQYVLSGGGGVFVGGTFTMTSGSITGNTADFGGGVRINDSNSNSTFTMTGGTISGNKATHSTYGYGGGVSLLTGAFNLEGGTITGNTAAMGGGGVGVEGGTFTVSGTPTITGNTMSDDDATVANVYLKTGYTITIGTNGLSQGASMGVTLGAGKGAVTGAAQESDLAYFVSDNSDYTILYQDNKVYVGVEHVHGICGNTKCEDASHKDIQWTEWTDANSLPSAAGYYFLSDDLVNGVTLADTWKPASGTYLCLNGKTITYTGTNDRAISVLRTTFTLTDCGTDGTLKVSGTNASGLFVTGYFHMYNGTITGGSANYGGGGVYLSGGSMYMYGGTITGNKASNYGGGVYLASGTSAFNMTGGTITGNKAATGDGVYVAAGTFQVSGQVNVTENTTSNVYLAKDKVITIGGTLDAASKIGVTMNTVGKFTSSWSKSSAETTVFASDDSTYGVLVTSADSDAELMIHAHNYSDAGICDCGYHQHKTDETNDYVPVSSLSNDMKAGNYVLTQNVELADTWTPESDVKLDLAGYNITSTGTAIQVNTGKTLEITDCQGTGTISSTSTTNPTVYANGTLKLYGGNINGKNASETSGVVEVHSNFYLVDGTVTGDTGVNGVYASSTLTMSGGKITGSNNGVYVVGSLTVTGGEISGNNTGVYLTSGALQVSGGSITKNKTGVNVTGGTFTVTGKPSITGNVDGSTTTNVSLANGTTITIGSAGLESGATIGVTLNSTTGLGTITSGWSNSTLTASDVFTSDAGHLILVEGAEGSQEVALHEHSYTYAGSGAVITATCSNDYCSFEETATLADSNTNPSYTYTGTAIEPTTIGVTTSTNWPSGTLNVGYENNTNAGHATAKITVSNGEGKEAAVATLNFTINKATLTPSATAQDKTYDGSNSATASVTFEGLQNSETLSSSDYTITSATFGDKNVGSGKTVTVTVSLNNTTAANNYQLSTTTCTTTATISAKELTPTNMTVEQKEYDGTTAATISTYTLSTGVDGEELTVDQDFTVSAVFDAAVAGTDKATFTFELKNTDLAKNYTLSSSGSYTVSASIVRKPVDVPTLADLTYNGNTQAAYIAIKTDDLFHVVSNVGGINVGDYSATLALNDTSNYEWKIENGDNDSTNQTLSYKITQATNTWKTTPSISGWTYGDTANKPVYEATFGNDDVKVEYKLASAEDTAYTETVPTDAGSYTVRFTVAEPDNSNYTSLEATASLTIAPKAITAAVTVSNKTYDGTNTATVSQVTFMDNADNAVALTTDDYTASATFNNVNVGKQSVTATVTLNASVTNYTLTSTTCADATISQATLEITGATASGKTFDGTTDATITAVTFKDKDGNAVTLTKDADYTVSDAAFATANAGEQTVTGTVALIGTAASNYTLGDSITCTAEKVTISPKALTFTGATVSDKTYDGTASAKVTAVTFTGEVDGYALTAKDYEATAQFKNISVGEDKLVTVTLKLNDTNVAKNYTLSSSEYKTSATITAKDISDAEITLGDALTYNGKEQTQAITSVTVGELTVTTYTVSGNKQTDAGTDYELTVTGTGNFSGSKTVKWSIAAEDISNAKVTLTSDTLTYNGTEQTKAIKSITVDGLTLGDGDYTVSGNKATAAGKYTMTITGTGNFTGTVTKAWRMNKLDITDAVITLGNELTYTGKAQTQTITSVTVDGVTVDTYKLSGNKKTDVDEYELTVTGTGNFSGSKTVEWSIAPKDISKAEVVKITLGEALTYNGEEQTKEVTAVKADGLKVTFDVSGNTATAAGKYELTITGTENFTGEVTKAWSIAKATLTVTAKDNNITYGDEPSNDGVSYAGFVGTDDVSVLKGTLSYDIDYEQFGDVGSYTITPSGLKSSNYKFVYENGTLTVEAKTLTITADTLTKKYSEDDPELTYKVEGLVGGDTVEVVLARAEGETVDDYNITAETLNASDNYTIEFVPATLTITENPGATIDTPTTDEDGNTVVTKVNDDNKVVETIVTDPEGNVTKTEFAEDGETVTAVTKTDTAGNVTKTEYEEDGKTVSVVTETDTDGNVTETVYDNDADSNVDNVVTVYDANGEITKHQTNFVGGAYILDGFDPELIEGDGLVYDGESSMKFRSNDELENFLKVILDEKELDAQYFNLTRGSIRIELKTEYLDTLEPGEHSLTIVSLNGEASGTFTIPEEEEVIPPAAEETKKPEPTETPVVTETPTTTPTKDAEKSESAVDTTKTKDTSKSEKTTETVKAGDSSHLELWAVMFLLSAGGVVGCTTYTRRKKEKKSK